jgi:DNA replication protein DnaC
MLSQVTLNQMKELQLKGMLQAFDDLKLNQSLQNIAFLDGLTLLIQHEMLYRQNLKQEKLLKNAQLKYNQVVVENIDLTNYKKLSKTLWEQLVSCQWLYNNYNLLITGSTGVGKTFIACALGHQACRAGFSVKYFRMSKLLEKLRITKADGSFHCFVQQITKFKLLILDDWGLEVLNAQQRIELLDLIEERHKMSSLLITSQMPTKGWYDIIGDATVADALLDRIFCNSFNLQLETQNEKSMRANKFKDEITVNSVI